MSRKRRTRDSYTCRCSFDSSRTSFKSRSVLHETLESLSRVKSLPRNTYRFHPETPIQSELSYSFSHGTRVPCRSRLDRWSVLPVRSLPYASVVSTCSPSPRASRRATDAGPIHLSRKTNRFRTLSASCLQVVTTVVVAVCPLRLTLDTRPYTTNTREVTGPTLEHH